MITSEEIKARLWNGANELRGSMDASRYKDYMLGLMFYKFLSDQTLKTFATTAGISNEEGDGLGYDIRYWDKDGKEIHVEVKSTTSSYVDGFEMTRNEIEASKNTNYDYQIYIVYDLQVKTKDCKIKIYTGPVDDENFVIETTKVVVFQK